MVFYNNIDPVLFHIGPLEIRYYGIIYMLGFIITYYLIIWLAKERKLNFNENDAADYLIYLLIGNIIGARLFEVLFYEPAYYLSNPLQIFAVWKGGLSFHGGLVGMIVGAFFYVRKKKINFYDLADITVIPAAIALFLGRIANFINGELYGKITNLPWGVKFQNAEGFRHPTQIYEALKNMVIFVILWNIRDKNLPKGFLFWSFITLYGVFRFFIEFLKDPIQIGGVPFGLTIGQWFALPMFVIGGYMLYKLKRE